MRILLVDDHREVSDSLSGFLVGCGHTVEVFTEGVAALRRAESVAVDLVLSDLRMPDLDGLQLIKALDALEDPPACALMTAFGDTATAIEAMRLGAVDYLAKPIDVRDLHRLVERIERGLSGTMRPSESLAAQQLDGLVVAGPAMARVVHLADRLHQAPHLPCLIEAETGCGKELIARRIHHGGVATPARPFVALNCAAIAPGLFEAELFGYAAGAFTGAVAGGQEGKLALAGEGTLFLDEVGDLPLDQQAKLLRVLEERTFYPIGSNKLQRFRARLVCASNLQLVHLVETGRFRQDLFYRLKAGHLIIPPLRERREEIPVIARALAARQPGGARLSLAAERHLAAESWPGNVRQLAHALELAAVLAEGRVIGVEHLLPPGQAPAATVLSLPAGPPPALLLPEGTFPLDAWHQAIIAAAVERCDGSPVRTAAYLGITRKVLYTLRKRYGHLK
jgi:DNA-binding NtrC family response regulator